MAKSHSAYGVFQTAWRKQQLSTDVMLLAHTNIEIHGCSMCYGWHALCSMP